MPSVPAVSSGEIFDVVAAPSSPRGDSGSNGDRFAEMLAGASQGRGPEGPSPAPPSPGKGKEPQAAAAPKGKGPEEAPRGGASNSGEGKPASASSEAQPGKPAAPESEEGEDTPASSGDGENAVPPGQEKAAGVISQLVAAAVLGLSRLTGGAPVAPDGENGLKLGAAASKGEGTQGEGTQGEGPQERIQANALGLALADVALSQGEGEEAQAAPLLAAEKPIPVAAAPAGAAFTQETEETSAVSGGLAPVDPEETPAAPAGGEDLLALAEEGEPQEDLPALVEEGEPQAALPPVEDGLPSDEAAPVRDEGRLFEETAPEETAEESAPRPTAAAQEEAEPGDAEWTDWARPADADGADAPERPAQMAAAAPPSGEGDFGQPAEGDKPGGQLLAERQGVQASGENAKAGPPAVQAAVRDPFMRTEVHRQVLEAALSRMSIAVREGMAQARIQLDPPSLGRLHMDLRMQDGAMSAKLTVETAWAKDAVMSGLRELREALQRQGVSLENFSVDVRANLNPGSFGQDRAGNQGETALYPEAGPEDEAGRPAERGPVFASPSLSGDGSINIFA